MGCRSLEKQLSTPREQLARPVKKVWSILIMARVHIKGIEGL
jgi:hypothetical protein